MVTGALNKELKGPAKLLYAISPRDTKALYATCGPNPNIPS